MKVLYFLLRHLEFQLAKFQVKEFSFARVCVYTTHAQLVIS